MGNTLIYLGIGAGVIGCAWAGINYFKKKKELPEVEQVDKVSYDMLIQWLKEQRKAGLVKSGSEFCILQHSLAMDSFSKLFPKKSSKMKGAMVLAVMVLNDDEPVAVKYYMYNVMSDSLKDILPEDTQKSFIQKIS